MADVLPAFDPGDAITCTASAAISGGQVVRLTGNRRVAPAAAGNVAFGIALRDAPAEAEVSVQRVGIFRLRAAAAVAASDVVVTAANGDVAPIGAAAYSGAVVGKAVEAIAAGARGLVGLTC